MFAAFLISIAIQLGQVHEDSATPQQIEKWIKELGHDSFTVREEATKRLWRAGKSAEAELESVANSDDREIAFRAKFILERFRMGIYPDTPADVVQLIKQYHAGNLSNKQTVLRMLQQKKLYRTMLALVRTEPDPNMQKSLAQSFLRNTSDVVEHLLVDGEFARAEELIEWGAEFDTYGTQQSNYAALLFLRDKIDKKIVSLKSRNDNQTNVSRFIGHLFKVKGDHANAEVFAKKAGDNHLMADLHFRQDNWAALSNPEMIPGDQGVEKLGFAAAIHQLARNQKEFDVAIAGLKQLAIDKPDRNWMCAEALMISGQWQAAIDLQSEKSPINSFRVLVEQTRHADAFKLVGIAKPRTESARWFNNRTKLLDPTSDEMSAHFRLGLFVARTLLQLNEQDEAATLFDELRKAAVDEKGVRIRWLIDAELKAGLKEQAYKHATVAMVDPARKVAMLQTFFKTQAKSAEIWLPHFILATKDGDKKTALQKVDELLRPTDDRLTREQLEMLIEGCLAHAPSATEKTWMKAIAEVCVIHEQYELARIYIEKELDSNPTSDGMLRLADSFAKEDRWQDAADSYKKAWELDRRALVALYLQGHALQQTDQVDEGKRLVKLAELLPLADLVKRGELAKGLALRGMLEQALEQWELMLKFGAFHAWEGSQAWAVRDAARNVAFYKADTDKLRSASLRRRRLFYLLKTNSSFTDVEYYARVMHLIHESQALGLIEKGDFEQAASESLLAFNARPDRVDGVIKIVQAFETANQKTPATNLFDKTFDLFEAACRDFPNSAHHHNNLAWLAARCERRLDDALAHAKRAVELKPDYAAYVDTLAEAYFRVGDRENAVKTANHALELSPDDEHLKNQLVRFQGGDE